MVKLPEYGRFVWFLTGHLVKRVKPPEPKKRITVRLPQSLVEKRSMVFNELRNRYGRRTAHSLGEMDRETYARGSAWFSKKQRLKQWLNRRNWTTSTGASG